MQINNLTYKLNKLSAHVSRTFYSIFNLFFNDDIFQLIVNYINKYATKYLYLSKKNKSFTRK